MRQSTPELSILITAHRSGPMLDTCLESASALVPAPREVIVAVDGPCDAAIEAAKMRSFNVVTLPGAPGVSAARNAGANAAGGEIMVFVDSDVKLPADFVSRATQAWADNPDAAAIIGSYDASPAAAGLVSRYRNLLHHYTHQHAAREAQTFWAGCGAIRREVFLEAGGFDENYKVPSVEDIELGYRLRKAGHSIRLVPSWQVKHLKRWRLRDLLMTDIFRRAAPWTRLLRREERLDNDLNITHAARLSALLVCLAAAAFAAGLAWPSAFVASAAGLSIATALNWRFYRFLAARGGWLFAAACLPLHWLYFLGAAAGFALGTSQHLAGVKNRNTVADTAG
ncbi:MAG: glycosyltransferase [Chthoniobacterales bacterium]|nr:glycosyltransferase [Chthoniobacterales bacterium]